MVGVRPCFVWFSRSWEPPGRRLSLNLAHVVSQPIFDIPRLVEAARHQLFDSILGGGSPERTNARIPPGADLDVRRQAGVDEALGVSDRPLVESGDPRGKCIYESVQIGVGQRPINVAIGFGLVCSDVFRAQEYLYGAVSPDESWKPSHWAAAGDHPHAHLPLR